MASLGAGPKTTNRRYVTALHLFLNFLSTLKIDKIKQFSNFDVQMSHSEPYLYDLITLARLSIRLIKIKIFLHDNSTFSHVYTHSQTALLELCRGDILKLLCK